MFKFIKISETILKYLKYFPCFESSKNIHLLYIFRQSFFFFENMGSSFSKILNLFFSFSDFHFLSLENILIVSRLL
jgi:hypothetical protein